MREHRLDIQLLLTVILALALSGCTTTQARDGTKWAAGELIAVILDAATGSGKAEPREYEPGQRRYCDPFCEHREEVRRDAYVAEVERRQRLAESRAFQAEFDEFMRQLEEAERASASSPVSMVTRTSWQIP